MAKIVKCTETTLPQTLADDTIYVQVDSANPPTEIEKLYLFGLEFTGGGVPAGTPAITKPSGTTLNLGNNEGSGVSKAIEIKANSHITGDLTVGLAANSNLSFDTTNLPSGVTYNSGAGTLTIAQATAMQGVNITIVYGGSGGAEIEGGLIITGGGATPKSVVVVVVVPTPEEITAVKFTGSQWLKTDYFPNPNTEFELDCQFVANSHTTQSGFTPDGPCPYFLSCEHEGNNRFNFQVGSQENNNNQTAYRIACYNNTVNTRSEIVAFNASANHSGMTVRSTLAYSKLASSMSMTFNGASSYSTVPLKENTMLSELAICHSYYFDAQFNSFDLIVYRFKIIENGVIVRDYKPVTLDGVPGLYDYVNNNFISSETNVELVPIS
jgi:hypothetical protein